ncbi:GFA family protein, partial [Caenimonas koreensis]
AICLSASSLNSSVYLALGFLPICRFSLPNYTSARNPFFGGKVTCHCGAVRLTLPSAPEKATSCNCSMCRRTGAIFGYYEFGTVSVQGHPENTEEYIWGDRTLKNIRCKTCGNVTHWEPLDAEAGARHGVNLRNFDPKLLECAVVRRFDGADTWTFLD